MEAYNILKDPISRKNYDDHLFYIKNNSQAYQENQKTHKRDDVIQTSVKWSDYPWRNNDYSNIEEKITAQSIYPPIKEQSKDYHFAQADKKYLFVTYLPLLLIFLFSINQDSLTVVKGAVPLLIFSNVIIMISWSILKKKPISWLFDVLNVFYSVFIVFIFIFIIFSHSGMNIFLMLIFFALIIYWAKKNITYGHHSTSDKILYNYSVGATPAQTHTSLGFLGQPQGENCVLNQYQWGTAGNLSDAVGIFGAAKVKLGTAGEKYTESLLKEFSYIPGVRVIHGLKFPTSDTADVDHVIFSGNKVIFIDSKQWSSGNYSWIRPDKINQYKDGRFRERIVHFPAAVEMYRKLLPNNAELHALIWIHGVNVQVKNPIDRTHGTVLLNTQDGIDYLGKILTHNVNGIINEDIFKVLYRSIK